MPAVNEPRGQVYLESLALGMPVLGLRRNALPEIIENGRFGYLLDKANPKIIATALLDAHSNPDRLARMSMETMTIIPKRYNGLNTAQRIIDTIKDSLKDY